jgi:hypothetical protein
MQFLLYNYKTTLFKDLTYAPDITSDSFVIRANSPITLLAKFEGITQMTVLRNPLDLIPSSVTRSMHGLGDNVILGISAPHENNYVNVDRLILSSFDVYKYYLYGIEKNIKNLKAFTFEQVTSDINYVLKELIGVDVSNENIESLKKSAYYKINTHNKGDIGINNALPVEKKPKVYYEAKDTLLNHKNFNDIQKLYEHSKNLILDQQGKW